MFLDRCHRIGQTRDVHIYRLISERSIEENIVKKANQKRLLGDLAIEGGNFTTAFFKKSTIKDLFDTNTEDNETQQVTELPEIEDTNALETTSKKATKAFEKAIATVEDNTDLIVSCIKPNYFKKQRFFVIIFLPKVTMQIQNGNGVLNRLLSCFKCMGQAC